MFGPPYLSSTTSTMAKAEKGEIANMQRGKMPDVPQYDGKTQQFEYFEKQVDVYKRLCSKRSVPSDEAALSLLTGLTGRAQVIAMELDVDVIETNEDGVAYVMTHLKNRLKGEAEDRDLDAALNFDKCWRKQGQKIADFVAEFERKYQDIKATGMLIPQFLLSLILLIRCRISDASMRAVKTTATVQGPWEDSKPTFAAIVAQLKRMVPSDEPVTTRKDMILQMQGEIDDADDEFEPGTDGPAFERIGQDDAGNAIYMQRGRGRARGRGRGRGRGYGSPPPGPGAGRGDARKNPIDQKTGEVTKCAACGSEFHWLPNCPTPEGKKMHAENVQRKKDQAARGRMHYTDGDNDQGGQPGSDRHPQVTP